MEVDTAAPEDLGTSGAMVTSLCWVRKGYAKAMLESHDLNDLQLKAQNKMSKKISKKAQVLIILLISVFLSNRGGKSQEMGKTAKQMEADIEDLMQEEEDDEDEEHGAPIFTPELAKLKAEAEGKDFVMTVDEDVDGDDEDMEGDGAAQAYPDAFSDDEDEKEDFTIRKSDALIVSATADNDHSNLEVYIYEHEQSNLYVHHEIILSSYPLCLEWLPSWQGEKANMVIVGTFLPEIEIWNLDSEDCAPVGVLGSVEASEQAKKAMVKKFNKKKDQENVFSDSTHTDAIMSLSLNPFQNEYLASGSADNTVRIWDVEELAIKASYQDIHTDKVQSVRWNRVNEQVLLSGGYDGLLNVVDIRQAQGAIQYKLGAECLDVECTNWHQKSEHHFIVGTESGMMVGYDTRQTKGPVFQFQAHKKGLTSVDFSPHISSMVATVGTDKKCRIWDVNQLAAGEKACVSERDLKQGSLHSLQFYVDEPWVLAAGGSKGEVAIWDTEESEKIRDHFKEEAKPYLTKNYDLGRKEKELARKAKENAMDEEEEDEEGEGNSDDFEDCSDDSESEQDTTEQSKTQVKAVSKAAAAPAKPARKGKW